MKRLFYIFILLLPCVLFAEYTASEIAELKRKAEGGDAYAQEILAVRFARGDGVERDRNEAEKWFSRAADQGLNRSQMAMGLLFSKSASEAAAWLAAAHVNGQEKALEHWSDYIERLLAYELEKSQKLAEQIATKRLRLKKESPEQLRPVYTAKLLRDIKLKIFDELVGSDCQIAVPRDRYALFEEHNVTEAVSFDSFETCLQMAQEGFAPAQFALSKRYESGDGILKNEAGAKRWLIASAEQGYMPAIKKSGVLKYAFRLHQEGNLEATYYLSKNAYSYRNDEDRFYGESTYISTYNKERYSDYFAYKKLTKTAYLTTAAIGGHIDAQHDLALHFLKESNFEEAYKWFGISASDKPESAVMAGFLRGMGWGCPKNYKAGFLLLLASYKNLSDCPESFTSEMYDLARQSVAGSEQLFERLWFDCLQTIYSQKFEKWAAEGASLPAWLNTVDEKPAQLWCALLELDNALTESSFETLKQLSDYGIDTSEVLSLAQSVLKEQEEARERIDSEIEEKKSAIGEIYSRAISAKRDKEAEQQRRREERQAEQQRRREERQKEERQEFIIMSAFWLFVLACGLFLLYHLVRKIRSLIIKHKSKTKKPLRNWQKVLSGWVLWGVLAVLYIWLVDDDVSEGVILFPPLAATLVFLWTQWLKARKQNTEDQ